MNRQFGSVLKSRSSSSLVFSLPPQNLATGSSNSFLIASTTFLTLWSYGHQGAQGSGPGYLAHPDDAYVVAHRRVMVADIINCRVVWLSRAKRVVRSIGRAGNCTHDPPTALLPLSQARLAFPSGSPRNDESADRPQIHRGQHSSDE